MPSSSVPAVDHAGSLALARDAKYEEAICQCRKALLAKASQRQEGVYPTCSFQTRRIARSEMKSKKVLACKIRGRIR
jgi:hypothetical protein